MNNVVPSIKRAISITIAGYYGAGNAGDELLLKFLLSRLSAGANITVLSVNPQHTKSLHKVDSVYLYDLEAIFKCIVKSHLFILGGGGLLQSYDRFTYDGLQHAGEIEVAAYVRPLLLAKQFGVPTMAWAQGVGPLITDEAKNISKAVFNLVDLVSVRDAESLNLLAELDVNREIICAPDPIWSMPLTKITDGTYPEKLVKKKNIVITLRPWEFATDIWSQRLAQAIAQYVDPALYRITLLPFVIASQEQATGAVTGEKHVVHNMQSLLPLNFDQQVVTPASFSQLLGAIAEADLAICMRLHAQILYHLRSTPVVSIQYDQKMKIASQAVDHNPWLCVSLDATQDQWNSAITNLLKLNIGETMDTKKRDACIDQAKQHTRLLDSGLLVAQHASESGVPAIEHANFDWLGLWLSNQPHSQQAILQVGEAKFQQRISDLKSTSEQLAESIQELQIGAETLKNTVDEKLSEIQALEKKLADASELVLREKRQSMLKLQTMKSTWSWKITKPLRFLRHFIRSPSYAIYLATKEVYGWLPLSLKAKVFRWRNFFVQNPKPPLNSASSSATDDMTWETFSQTILLQRNNYKGIFIQECVIDWNVPLYQRPQHIATALGKLGYLVIYRTSNWSHADTVNGFREIAKNVWLSNSIEVDSIENSVRSVYSTAYPDVERIERTRLHSKIVYEYIDHIDPEISGEPEKIEKLNSQKTFMINGGADFIVASAKKLESEIRAVFGHSQTFLIPNGADCAHYRSQDHLDHDLPVTYRNFCSKFSVCLGYFGAIAPWLDYPMIQELAKLRPDVGFVFIGPDYFGGHAHLPVADNVLITGAVNYLILPLYARKFDICWIPFKAGEIAKTTSPLKLFEYFAMEKPVLVGADMLECVAYPEVMAAGDAGSMSQCIDRALQLCHSNEYKARLRQLADENDWMSRAADYAQIFTMDAPRE